MQKKECLTIKDLGLTESFLKKRIGGYGIYFKSRGNGISLNTEIFRYLKLSYLMDLIDNNNLYIPNRNSFTDLRDRKGMEKFIMKNPFDFKISPAYSTKEKRRRNQLIETKDMCMDVCISCWTMDKKIDGSTDESFLMWKAYSDIEMTCRIKTTIKQLIDCINELPCDLVIADVDYNDNGFTFDKLVFQKSQYYESEHEVRLVALTRGKDHVNIKIDPYTLLGGIKTSPFLTPYIESCVINGLRRKYTKLKDVIEPSKVMEYPYV